MELSSDECAFNAHLYRVSKSKEDVRGSICLGVAPKGVRVFEVRPAHDINMIATFNWCTVMKLNADVSDTTFLKQPPFSPSKFNTL